jgi:NAD(P)-dependent dehydrogenase (short-subunit alcohol dehydrogenase family)
MDLGMQGRTAFISGSSGGIGYAVAAALVEEGVRVVLSGRDGSRLAAAMDRLRADHPGAMVSGRAVDLADSAATAALLEELDDVDILVNSVGSFDLSDFLAVDDDQWRRLLDVNLMSGVRLSRGLLPGMLQRGWGRIVFLSSESGVNVPGDMIPYGVTKAGMLALGNGLAKLTRGTEVTVNTVLGGPTFSDGVASAISAIAEARGLPADVVKQGVIGQNRTTLLERFIEPSEIAALVAYLASPRASATNGAALRADGGMLTAIL